jgi:hypothetical protein
MKNTIVALCLGLLCATANAEWIKLGTMSDQTIAYVDPATKKRAGTLVKLWTLYDHPEPQITGSPRMVFFSTKFQKQFNCPEDMHRSVYMSAHVGRMGGGNVAYTENVPNTPWVPVSPGSMTEAIFKYACDKP